MPSSPVLLHIPCLCLHAALYFSCHHHWFCLHILQLVPVPFSIVIPTSFNILMKCFSHLFYLFFYNQIHAVVFHASPTPFAPRGHVKSHAHNNKEMAFMYTEIAGKVLRRFRYYSQSYAGIIANALFQLLPVNCCEHCAQTTITH